MKTTSQTTPQPTGAGPPQEWIDAARRAADRTGAALEERDAELTEAVAQGLRDGQEQPTPAAQQGAEREALADVWQHARQNHASYSATGSLEDDIRFMALGLTGEAGELANFVKKRWRDGEGHDQAIRYEIADVCAYAFMLADLMGQSPADLIDTIAEKQRIFIAKMEAIRQPAPEGGGE